MSDEQRDQRRDGPEPHERLPTLGPSAQPVPRGLHDANIGGRPERGGSAATGQREEVHVSRGRLSAVVAAVLAVGAVGAGGVMAASQSDDEAALQQRPARRRRPQHRAADRRADAQDDARREAPAADAALRRADQRRRGGQAASAAVFSVTDPAQDRPLPARSRSSSHGCTSRSCSPSTRSTASGRSSRSRWRPRSSFDPDVAFTDHRSAPSSRPRSASSRSTARWSTSRTSRAGGASPRPRARTRT